MVLGGGGLWEIISIRSHEDRALMKGILVLIRFLIELASSALFTVMGGDNEKMVICKSEEGSPQNPSVLAP